MIATLKAIHIAAMLCWCAGLVALPLLLITYGHAQRQLRYTEFRMLTHYGYVGFATPAAVIAVVAGTALIFVAEVFDLWLIAKLAFVSAMAMVHAWIGHLIEQSGLQRHGQGDDPTRGYRMPYPGIALAVILPAIAAILWLVLAKPDLAWAAELLPFIQEPRGQLP
ncbi:CopD family protein [Paracoccus sp. WLY502]|uniref:CopD family protein n=1 Tax=Paracoccus yibinensis TaxID=3068891 RepID=UPI002796472D|nr:CopD family protein [Paracoccus sp. WLY502]MDQ1899527.1 CopD family protein [Paracoccus sp. WLY502]